MFSQLISFLYVSINQMSCHHATATKMYASFILHTICHYLKKVGKIPEQQTGTISTSSQYGITTTREGRI